MENFWTSKKSVYGLRHFVLVNKLREKGQIVFLMVSVIDSEIYLKITYGELIKSGNWERGWLDLPKALSITEDYIIYKSINKKECTNRIFINDDSLFNIS